MNINCPRCKGMTVYTKENPYRPFCSKRCQLLDTAAWADEEYTISASTEYYDRDAKHRRTIFK